MTNANFKLFSLLLTVFTSMQIMAQTWHDVTTMYLQNAGFDDNFHYKVGESGNVSQEIRTIDGWTNNFTMNYTITGVYQWGTAKTFNKAEVPATGFDGTSQGGGLALSTGWSQAMLLEQSVKLPKGKYGLVTAVYNGATVDAGTSRMGWLPASGTSVLSAKTSFPVKAWQADTVWFEIDALTAGKIQIGYQAAAMGSDNSAKILIDFVQLLRDTPLGKVDVDGKKEDLKLLLDQATTLYGDGQGNAADALKQVIDAAQGVYDNAGATMEEVTQSMTALEEAMTAYRWNNPTGEMPQVSTDKRYARGATMAFGRMTATGTNIIEKGFCFATHQSPTINDQRSLKTLENNGLIYCLENLEPGTEYFMRAYAITDGYQVGYGDEIRFYTIPKGNISYTIREGGDAAAVQRITNAVKTAVNYWNNLTSIPSFNTSVGYNSGVPTAECSYGGWMSVGSNASYQATGTILHELLHGIGVIPWADTEWSRHNLRSGVNGDGKGTGYWLGDRVTEVLRFWDNNSSSRLNGDYQHMWPYGINGASEDNGKEVLYIGNGLVCQALGEDGLQHTSSSFARPYHAFNHQDGEKMYIRNESEECGLYNSFLVTDKEGLLVWKRMSIKEAMENDSAAWLLSFTPNNQYYQIKNAATGAYVTYVSAGKNGIKTVVRERPLTTNNFQLMKGRIDVTMGGSNTGKRGYWVIYPQANWQPQCLTSSSDGAVAATTFDIANTSTKQRWLILTKEEIEGMELQAAQGMKTLLNEALTTLKTLTDVPHREEVAGTDEATQTTVDRVKEEAATATSSEEVQLLIEEVQTATLHFLEGASPTDISKPFVLTYMLDNPGMDSGDGWSVSPVIGYSCGEFYQKTFDMYQTVKALPAGTYQWCANAFQRPGSSSSVYDTYMSQSAVITAWLYAGNNKQKLMNICEEMQTKKIGGNESTVGGSLYIPNDMQAASLYFKKGLYDNRLTFEMNEGGDLTMGIKVTSAPSSYWCIFDNFRLYYDGRTDIDKITSISEVSEGRHAMTGFTVYSLDGRLLMKNASSIEGLPRGLYIINGKKVMR